MEFILTKFNTNLGSIFARTLNVRSTLLLQLFAYLPLIINESNTSDLEPGKMILELVLLPRLTSIHL
jgi:hypothetical protein